MTHDSHCELSEKGSVRSPSSGVPPALSHSIVSPGLPSQPLTLGVGTATDSHWRDAGGLDEWSVSSSALGRHWTQGPPAPHSSPAIEIGKWAGKSKIRKREKAGHELPLSPAQPVDHQFQIFPLPRNQPIQILCLSEPSNYTALVCGSCVPMLKGRWLWSKKWWSGSRSLWAQVEHINKQEGTTWHLKSQRIGIGMFP